ncbi:putative trifunctional 2-polyprenylphenol hydroxylase/glutamate synthase subunit beta/ferritin domain-containing protein [Anaerohalosphaera lusitana]|uniref:Putative trifunctional 2-polyprenylphenol hydroxylase/glutamate synthase subunit beta/ferritin domain-containing protein n=1 Tax=Anaerohalosphaera lusitana TaxID=1936003 RepID=A0A1U9NNL0_9BACT|nr:ferritin family protein [Anaerohalosphaera lusitana]AQT69493.1 putative trifunctional 2-polyprenylphenol hydroxylase/glutamate synthase subunit beta/ferritin domain-containing protein [Anaerohalosphaera lusitana]
MSITFNADEIFEMAIEIERNGAKFYRKAADNSSDPETKKMLTSLAEMEDGHEKTFLEMRESLNELEKEENTFDPEGEAEMYLQSMASAHGYEGKKSLDETLTGNESREEILRAALGAEKNSVAFYLGIKDIVPQKAGKDKVQNIIREEMSHIQTLNKALASIR